MSIAGHVSREMLEHYSEIRMEAKHWAVESLDNVTITANWLKLTRGEERNSKGIREIIGRDGQI